MDFRLTVGGRIIPKFGPQVEHIPVPTMLEKRINLDTHVPQTFRSMKVESWNKKNL